MHTPQEVLDELRDPNIDFTREQIHQGFEILKRRAGLIERQTALSFGVGDKVCFQGRNGRTEHGVVKTVNVKTITVSVAKVPDDPFSHAANWHVSATLLRREPMAAAA